mgnify:CR=1 FL=1
MGRLSISISIDSIPSENSLAIARAVKAALPTDLLVPPRIYAYYNYLGDEIDGP